MNNRLSDFTRLVGIRLPIVQGPMNGASPPELVSAVSNAGGLGSLAAAILEPAVIIEKVKQVRARTPGPFNVNLFVLQQARPDIGEVARAQAYLQPSRATLGLASAPTPTQWAPDFPSQLEAVLSCAPPVVSFTFGLIDPDTVSRFQRAGSRVIGTATTVAEARAWEDVGADAVCVQGAEAGGHRATFLGDFEQSSIGLMALVPQVAQAITCPMIAAGGIMTGRAIAAALTLGADAAQLGTAFLSCPESGIAPAWRDRLLRADDDSTRLTRTFSGRYARGIVNDFMTQMQRHEHEVPPYPIQNALTADIRRAAVEQGNSEFMSLWAGQGVGLSRGLPAAQLMDMLAGELLDAAPTHGQAP